MSAPSEKKVALITGGSGYVGSAIANRLSKDGWHVVSLSRNPKVAEGVEGVSCDIADTGTLTKTATSLLVKYPTIDAFIHCAVAPTTRTSLENATELQVDNEFKVTVTSIEVLAGLLESHMEAESTFIAITTQSLEKSVPEKNIGAYLPAKQALRDFLRSLSSKWEEKGIRVYAVAPVFLPGGLNKELPEGVRKLLSRQTDGTEASAEDVAGLVSILCKQNAEYQSGTSITVPARSVSQL